MAKIVGAFAASHAPLIARDWKLFSDGLKARLESDFLDVGRRVRALEPDVILMIAPDHWNNFFLNNLPAICLGVGEANDGPPEPFMRDFAREIPGHPALGDHILREALRRGFEPALSHRMILDHGFCIPLLRMRLSPLPPVLPIIINGLEPPMMSLQRCAEWGDLLASAIADYREPTRVVIIATGGLSHSIGESTMGWINEEFDRRCIELFTNGDRKPLVDYLEKEIPTAGNGTHEMRNWMVAHTASGSRGFEMLDYFPCPEVYVGCGFAEWRLDG